MRQRVIGNKSHSSWMMRPGVLMKPLGIAFEERKFGARRATDACYALPVLALSQATCAEQDFLDLGEPYRTHR